MKQGKEMTDKTTKKNRNINKELNREKKKYSWQENTEDTRSVVKENNTLEVLKLKNEIGKKTIHKVINKEGGHY